MTKMKRIFSLALALILSLSLSVPAFAAETAANIQLTKTEGTVTVSKSNGKSVSMRANMRLYNGYNVTTAEKSYAWINLDSTKLMKLDASSSVEVRKNGTKLEVNVKSGSVSFDVSEKLSSGESLNVSTSTMSVGIRGTCGWARVTDQWVSEICLLEGSSQCVVADPVTNQIKSAQLVGGDTAQCVVYPQDKAGDKCDILMERQTTEGIPGFVLTELVQDVGLCDKILDDSGLDVLADLAKEAGGDPSGRSPDGKSASVEVLGQAEQVRSHEESAAAQRQEEIRKEEESQEHNVSKDPVWEQGQQPNTGSSSGGGSSGGSTAPTYTVTFDSQGGSAVTPATVAKGGKVTSPAAAPTRAGCVFSGWYKEAECTTAWNFGTDTVTEAVTLYAKWTAATFTVTFDLNGGPSTVEVPDPVMTDGAGKAALPEINHTPNADGNLAFAGWYTEPSGGQKVTNDTGFTSSQTLYAQWTGWDWEYIGKEKTLRIFGTGNMTDYHLNPYDEDDTKTAPWIDSVEEGTIETLIIDEGIRNVGGYLFVTVDNVASGRYEFHNKYPSLSTVSIAKSVTSIGRSAFRNCDGLNAVDIPNSVTSIGDAAFEDCTGLTDITVPGSVVTIGTAAFGWCYGLANVTIENGVTDIGDYAFSGCTDLTGVTVPGSVTSIGKDAFCYCDKLEKISYSGTMEEWYAANPGNRARVPEDCVVRCSDGDIDIDWNFDEDIGTLRIFGTGQIDDYWGGSIPSIGNRPPWSIEHGYDIKSIVIEEGITRIGNFAFYLEDDFGTFSCPYLASVSIPNTVTSIGSQAFYGCDGLNSITFTGTTDEWSDLMAASPYAQIKSGVTVTCSNGTVTTS